MAASHGMHDHSRDLVGLFFGRLHYLSRPGGREIFGIHRLDRRHLLPDSGFARSTRFCDVASGDFDAYPGFSAPMGPAQTDRALDDSDLAVRIDHRSACIFHALQMVSSGERLETPRCGVRLEAAPILPSATHADRIVCVTLSLALDNYLMFHHTMRCSACEKNYGDYCDVQ